jgi:SSS family solute:Na+ symporter
VVQFFILMGGIVAVLWVVAGRVDGGLSGVIQLGIEADKIKFVRWELTWDTPNTLVLAIGAVYGFQNYAADQVVIQRFLSTSSIRESIKSFVACCGINYVLIFLLYLVGAFLFVFYQQFPGEVQGIDENLIYPHFILHELPAVVGGLVIAAIMAASMSSVDAGINSMSAVLISDYYRRLIRPDAGEGHYLRISRGLALGLGGLVILVGLLVNELGTNLLNMILYTHGWFAPPISAVFILGAMNKRANATGAIATCVLSPVIMITLTKLEALPPWSFGIVGMTVALLIGYCASWIGRAPTAQNLQYCQTLSTVFGRKKLEIRS